MKKLENLLCTFKCFNFVRINDVMDAKLTLKLDQSVIEKAKEYALLNKISLSRMIESYLLSLVNQNPISNKNEIEISPFIQSMRSGKSLPLDLDYKDEFAKYQNKKHK